MMATFNSIAKAAWADTKFSRLAIAATMAVFLLLALSYWWLENLVHEIFGTVLFVILGRHIYVHRAWFTNLFKGKYGHRRRVMVVLHAALLINMVVLLVTSIMISKSIFGFLHIPFSVPVRDLHWLSAYWVMVIVGIHLGLHWSRVMVMARSALGLQRQSFARTLILRVVTFVFTAFGAWSLSVLDVGTKLTFNASLNVWNFNTSVAPFFAHWLGVVMLAASITHYSMMVGKVLRP
nr:DUF4405 domain-containing protein [uncultured Rhodoferax sp.]